MDNAGIKRPLQLTLSHREKAQAACAECARLLSGGEVDQRQYDALRKDCERHVERAEAAIANVKKTIEGECIRLAEQLRQALDEKQRLLAGLAAQRVSQEEAHKTGRRLSLRIEGIRASISELNALHAARTSEDVGGFIDLPLDRYRTSVLKRAQRGARKASAPRLRLRPSLSLSNVIALAIVVLGLMVAAAFVFRIGPSGDAVRFEMRRSEVASEVVSVRCCNDGNHTITLWAPTSEDRRRHSSARNGPQYGISLYVREGAEGPWRLLPATEGCWLNQGLPLPGQNTFTIDPGISLDLNLDTRQLIRTGANPQAVKIECVTDSGKVVASFEVASSPP